MFFDLRDVLTEKVKSRVPRRLVRPLGSDIPLLEEPHLVFGSLKTARKNTIIPVARFFRVRSWSSRQPQTPVGSWSISLLTPHRVSLL